MNPKFDRMRPKSSEPGRPVKRSKPMGKNLLVNGAGRHTDVFSRRCGCLEITDFHRIPRCWA